jgi:putative DNA primase/helicase
MTRYTIAEVMEAYPRPATEPANDNGKARAQKHASNAGSVGKKEGAKRSYGLAAIVAEIDNVRNAQKGKRNDTLNKAAFSLGQLCAGGEIEDVREQFVEAAMDAGLGEREAWAAVQSGWNAGLGQPRNAKIQARSSASAFEKINVSGDVGHELELANTDEGHAERLANAVAGRCHFVKEWNDFVFYEGGKWQVDAGGVRLLSETKAITTQLCEEAKEAIDRKRQGALLDEARQSQNMRFKKGAMDLLKAQVGVAISSEALDRHEMLLPVANGVLDLESGLLLPHSPSYLNTLGLPWAYDPSCDCPRWKMFLEEVLPDADTIVFFHRLVGYILTGSTREQVLAFCYGGGANGKSVCVRILQELLGPYAIECPMAMLIASRYDRPTTDQADLRGKRLAVCTETPSGQGWNEPLVKHLTGSDKVKARKLYQDFQEFDPSHKLLVCGNYKPDVKGSDEGIWRRLLVIPFERTFPEDKRDTKLVEKLRIELPGIPVWAAEGCRLWQESGLGISAKVRGATSTYRNETDLLAPFLGARCTLDPKNVVSRGQLYGAFVDWMKLQGESSWPSTRAFIELVRSHGYEEGWGTFACKKDRAWKGIGLLSLDGHTLKCDGEESPLDPAREGEVVVGNTFTCGDSWQAPEVEAGKGPDLSNLAKNPISDEAPKAAGDIEKQWEALFGEDVPNV